MFRAETAGMSELDGVWTVHLAEGKTIRSFRSVEHNNLFSLFGLIYRASIKSFPDYKHVLQENYLRGIQTFFFRNVTQEVFLT